MRKLTLFSFLLLQLIIVSCNKNPMKPATASLNVKLIWLEEAPRGLLKLADTVETPLNVKVTLNPGGQVYTFQYSAHTGDIINLDPGMYSISVLALNANNKVTDNGSKDGIVVSAGKETSVTVIMNSFIPTEVTASTNSENYITISWNSPFGATEHKIYRSTFKSGSYSLVKTTYLTSWNDDDVDMARYYYYKIAASSSSGDSPQSDYATGYRKGWRFDDISIYDPNDGIGFYYDLRAYGFNNIPKMASIYAVYKEGSDYYYVPGSGKFNLVADTQIFTPSYEECLWDDSMWYLYSSWWDPNWQNNSYQQYISMKVYTSNNISMLNDPYYAHAGYYEISWTTSTICKPNIEIIRKLTIEESVLIDKLVMRNPNHNSCQNNKHQNEPNNNKRGVLINNKHNLK